MIFAFLAGMAAATFLVLPFKQNHEEDMSDNPKDESTKPTFSGRITGGISAPNIEASEIISRMIEVYASCSSYQDQGIVRTVFIEETGNRNDEKPFTTAFQRQPHKFRFEYQSKLPIPGASPMRHIIWSKGEEVKVWWDVQPGIQTLSSLAMAIAGATGVSSGSSLTTPHLLMPNMIDAWSIPSWTDLERLDDGVVNKAGMFRIQGTTHSGSKGIVWISKETFLIYRLEETNEFPSFKTETTTVYAPFINMDVDSDLLDFKAP